MAKAASAGNVGDFGDVGKYPDVLEYAVQGLDQAGDVVAKVSMEESLKRKRVFRSQLFVPKIKQLNEKVLFYLLPSMCIKRRLHSRALAKQSKDAMDKHSNDGLDIQSNDALDKRIALWLERYILVTTVLLIGAVWTQSHAWAWHHTLGGWTLRSFVGLLVLIRVGEILLQSTAEIVSDRLDVDTETGLATLALYVLQAVAIFAICSEYAAYASGYQHVFKVDPDPSGVVNFPSHWWDFVYVAGTNLTTFGTAYPPLTSWARLTVVSSSLVFVALFSVLLTFVVAQIPSDKPEITTDKPETAPGKQETTSDNPGNPAGQARNSKRAVARCAPS